MTGPADGKPFTVTTSTTNVGDFGVSVVTNVEGSAATNEKQVVYLSGPPTGGTFTLTFDGQTTGAIAFDASAATVDTALEALSNIGAGDVGVTGDAGGPWTVEFTGALAGVNVPLMTGSGSSLTGSGSVTVATTTQGAGGTNEVQRFTLTAADLGAWIFVLDGVQSASMQWNSSAANVQLSLEGMSNIGEGNVSVTRVPASASTIPIYWEVEFIGALAAQDINQMTTIQYGTPDPNTITDETITEGSADGIDEVQTITVNNAPTGGTFTVTFSGQTTSAQPYNESAANVQTDLEALSTIGAGNIAVTRAGSGTLSAPYVYTCTFQGTLVSTDVSEMTASGASLTGGAVNIATTQQAVAAVNEVETVTLTGSPTGGTFTLTFNAETTAGVAFDASAATLLAALEALATPVPGDFTVVGADGGPWTVTFIGAYAGTDVAAMTGSGTSLTGAGSQTFTASTTTTPTGPNWFDNAENWTTNTQPGGGDTVIFESSDVDCLYGIDTLSITLAALHIKASYTGKIGLAFYTDTGYYEYRTRFLTLGATLLYVGYGEGEGSGRINLNLGSVQTTALVNRTALSADVNSAALTIKGTHASNALSVFRGNVAVAPFGGDTSTLLTLAMGFVDDQENDVTVFLGSGVTLGTVDKSGGLLTVNGAVGTSLTQTAGTTIIDGAGAVAQLTLRGGTCYYNTTGALGGNTVVSGEAVLSFDQDTRTKTVTNPIELYGDEAQIIDTYKVITSLIVDGNEIKGDLSQLKIGNNVRITRGAPA